MLWNTQHERNQANHIISSGLRHSFLHPFVVLALKPPANGCNIVGYCMLRSFAYPAAYCCVLLRVVTQSLKPAKLLTQRLPTFLLFRDRRSAAQQCWICLHSSFQYCWSHVATHANYTWSPKSIIGCILPTMHCRSQNLGVVAFAHHCKHGRRQQLPV